MAKEFDTVKLQRQLSEVASLEGYKRDPLKYLELQDMLNELKDTSNQLIEMLGCPILTRRHSA